MEAEKLLYDIRFEDGLTCPRCRSKEVKMDSCWSFRCKSCRQMGRTFRFGLFTDTALGKIKLKPEVLSALILKYVKGYRNDEDFKTGCSGRSFQSFLGKVDGILRSRFFIAEGISGENFKSYKMVYFFARKGKIQLCNKNEAEGSVGFKKFNILEPLRLPTTVCHFFSECMENHLTFSMKRKAYFEHVFSFMYLYNMGLRVEDLREGKCYKILKELLKVEKVKKVEKAKTPPCTPLFLY